MLNDLLNQTCQVYEKTALSEDGRIAWGNVATLDCRAEEGEKRRLDPTGEVVITNIKFILPSTATINTESKIVYGSNSYRPVFINKAVGYDGAVHHYSVEAALWQG